jgi:polysaccharide export outer membrane protein
VILPFLLLIIPSVAQEEEWNERIQQMSTIYNTHSEYRLGPGDLVEIELFEIDDYEHELRVNSRGAVRIPLLGTVPVAGMTPSELEEELYQLFGENLIRDPQVSVLVKEYRSQTIFVLGAVQAPGQYQITHQLNLIDALAMAGGLDLAKCSDHAFVQHREARSETETNDKKNTSRQVNLKALLRGDDPTLNIPLTGGDVVNVPERLIELFYVIGEVNRPGAFEMPVDEELFLTQGLAWAGGPMKTAKLGNGILVRYEDDDRLEIPVDFEDIMRGSRPDEQIQANDVIFIPGSTAKSIGYGLLGVIPGTISGAIVYSPYRR